MGICMKITLNINDRVIKQLKEEAFRRGTTMSELVELSLRSLFQKKNQLLKQILLHILRVANNRRIIVVNSMD